MDGEQVTFSPEPFGDEVDPTFFFAGGSRREIVEAIKESLVDGVPLITLSGTEGSGKSMICRMVVDELGDELSFLYLDSGVESFDDLIGQAAAVLGIEQQSGPGDGGAMLDGVVAMLSERGSRLVIILDGAEQIYLATLERIRRMLDQVNGETVVIQLVVSGRPLFALNFKQLGIVAFEQIEERNYSLDILDPETTHRYLNHCTAIASGDERELFTPDMAEKIMHAARGNFMLINRLARQYLETGRALDEDGAVVLAAPGTGPADDDPGRRSIVPGGLASVDLDFLKIPTLAPRWYIFGGGLVIVVLALVLLLGGVGREDEAGPQAVQVPDLELEDVEPLETPPLPAGPDETVEPETTAAAREVVEGAAVGRGEKPASAAPAGGDEPAEGGDSATDRPGPGAESAAAEVAAAKPAGGSTAREAEERAGSALQAPAAPVEAEAPQPAAAEAEVAATPPEPVPEPEETTPEAAVEAAETTPEAAVEAAETKPEPATAVAETRPEPAAEGADTQLEPAPQAELATAAEKETRLPGSDAQVQTSPPPESAAAVPDPADEPQTDRDTALQEPVTSMVAPVDDRTLPAQPEPLPELEFAPVEEEKKVVTPIEQAVVQQESLNRAPPPPLIVTLQDEPKKRPPRIAPFEETQAAVEADEADTPPASTQESGGSVASVDTDVIYVERLAAGARWLVGSSRDKFTVQLVALTAEAAEENLKDILRSDAYQSLRDRLFILRRVGDPPTVMLYFGEYASQTEAQQARDNLPDSLRGLDPYTISIREAVNKAKAMN